MKGAASLKTAASIEVESLGNHLKSTNQQLSLSSFPFSTTTNGKKMKKSSSSNSKSKRKTSTTNSNSSNSSLNEKRSSSQVSKQRHKRPVGPKEATGDRASDSFNCHKALDRNGNELLNGSWDACVHYEGQKIERASSSLDKCAVLLANILGDEISDVIMNSTSLSDEDLQLRNHQPDKLKKSEVNNAKCYEDVTTELASHDQIPSEITDIQVIESTPSTDMVQCFGRQNGADRNVADTGFSYVKRASKLEDKLKRSGCYSNSTLSLNHDPSQNSVIPRNLNSTEISEKRNDDIVFAGNFTKQLREIMKEKASNDSRLPVAKDVNKSASDSTEISSMSQVLLTPEKVTKPTAPQESYDNTMYTKTTTGYYENESLMYSESLATSTPRHNRSMTEDAKQSLQASEAVKGSEAISTEALTKELEIASISANNSNSLNIEKEDHNENPRFHVKEGNPKPNDGNVDDDDNSTIVLLRTLNNDRSLTLEQKLSLVRTAGQASVKSSGEGCEDLNVNSKTVSDAVSSSGDTDKVLLETLSKLSSASGKFSSTPSLSKNVQSGTKVTNVKAQLACKIPNNGLLDGDVLRQRKLETIKEQLGVVNDIFTDIKSIASKRRDKDLNQAVEELEAAVSVLPSIVDKKIFDNELKFTVEPLQEKVILLESELAETKSRLEAMEKLHRESIEAKQKEITKLKDNFNQQMANEKLQGNKLKSAKASVEKDNAKLEEEVEKLREELKCQRRKLEDCSNGFSNEIKDIRNEITSALSEVQRQKSKLAAAERQNQELQWSIEAKNEEIRTFEELSKKQHESMSELMKELSFTRSSLHQQKSLANTMAQEVAALKAENARFDLAKNVPNFVAPNLFMNNGNIKQGNSVETQTAFTPTKNVQQYPNPVHQNQMVSMPGFFPKPDELVVAHAANLNFNQGPPVVTVSDRVTENVVDVQTPVANSASLSFESNKDMLGPFTALTQSGGEKTTPKNAVQSLGAHNVDQGFNVGEAQLMVSSIPVQASHPNSDGLSARSCSTSSSSHLSEPKDLEMSFDTNSYSNFLITAASENDTPRNKHDVDPMSSLTNVNAFTASSSNNSQLNFPITFQSSGVPLNNTGQLPPYLSEQFINTVNMGWNRQPQPGQGFGRGHFSPQMNSVPSIAAPNLSYSMPNGYLFSHPSMQSSLNFQQPQQGRPYNVRYPGHGQQSNEGIGNDTSVDLTLDSLPPASNLANPYSRSVPLLDFSSLSNSSSAIPSAKTESKFQEGIKMLDADIQKLQNSIQQLFAVGQKDQ